MMWAEVYLVTLWCQQVPFKLFPFCCSCFSSFFLLQTVSCCDYSFNLSFPELRRNLPAVIVDTCFPFVLCLVFVDFIPFIVTPSAQSIAPPPSKNKTKYLSSLEKTRINTRKNPNNQQQHWGKKNSDSNVIFLFFLRNTPKLNKMFLFLKTYSQHF